MCGCLGFVIIAGIVIGLNVRNKKHKVQVLENNQKTRSSFYES
jgi:hypothetical protein